MKVIEPPCYDKGSKTDCPDRHVGCASTCPKWAEYVENRDEEYRQKEIRANAKLLRDDAYHKEARKRYIKDRRRSVYK